MYKPIKCHGCFSYTSIVESSTTVQAPHEKFWYCKNCKDEVTSEGMPVSKPRKFDDTPDPDDEVEEYEGCFWMGGLD